MEPPPLDPADLEVTTLGPCRVESPLTALLDARRPSENYVDEADRVLLDDTLSTAVTRAGEVAALPGFEPGGPRRKIYFDPSKTRAGIVTCGGLCPGLNNVIRGLVLVLTEHYGIRRVVGFRNGYRGLVPKYGLDVVELTREAVHGIHEEGGTMLGTSRGDQDAAEMVDALERLNLNLLFVVGGDGTMRGAQKISDEIAARGSRIAVVGLPKTIDNDIPWIDHSFGFQTAFARAAESIRSAHTEARSTPGGVGLVKLMGRHSGFIACYAALAKGDADLVLVPEVPAALDGQGGVLARIRQRVASQGHAIVVVAEGFGQDLLTAEAGAQGRDASGNAKLLDVGPWLRRRIVDDFAAHGQELNLRYIDPSYVIRSVPANAYDAVFCLRLAHAAAHAAMAGRTAMVVGRWHGRFVHVPIAMAVSRRNTVDPHGDLWLSVVESTARTA